MSGIHPWLRPGGPGDRIYSRTDIITAHWVFALNYEYRKRTRRIRSMVSRFGWPMDEFQGRHHLSPNGQDIYDDIVAMWDRGGCRGRVWQ